MFKFEVPRPPSGGTRSICDELNDYMGEAEADFRRLWINPKFANFKILRLARKIFATTATSAPSERVFSKAGLLMAPLRSRTKDQTLERMTFLRTNLQFVDNPVISSTFQ